ncbi:MAG: PP2C family protein-serine/threonine phosphatase [Eubacteriales bacterium]|nr:PP2C family protein-serine/threonine phosphatase [Eubacteriales bacterium]
MTIIRQKRERFLNEFQWLNYFLLFLMFVLITCAAIMLPVEDMKETYIISFCFDIASLVFCTAVFVSSAVHDKDFESSTVIFKVMVFQLSATFFFEALIWLVDSQQELRSINFLVNELYIFSGNLSVWLFWRYLRRLLELRDKKFVSITRIFAVMLLLQVLLIISNVWSHWLFFIDGNGEYQRAGTYYLSHVFDFTVLAGSVAVILSTKMERRQKNVLSLFVFAPLAAGIISGFFPRMSLAHPAGFTAVIICFADIYLKKSNELTARRNEMDLASNIQMSMLPEKIEGLDGKFDIIGSMFPAREVGGDFYDFYRLDEDHVVIIIADVSGKGLPAAMFMMKGISTVKNYAITGLSVEDTMRKANDSLCKNNEADMFITAWMGILNEKTGRITFVNAGHNFPVLRKADGTASFVNLRSGIPLASFDNLSYKPKELQLEPGDILLLYTDGVTEAHSRTSVLFGDERLLHCVEKDCSSAEQLCDNVLSDIDRFTIGTDQFDDITMVAVKYLPS